MLSKEYSIKNGVVRPQLTPCFKHPEYDGYGDVPMDGDDICYSCLAAKKIIASYEEKLETVRQKIRYESQRKIEDIIAAPRSELNLGVQIAKAIKVDEAMPICYQHPKYKGLRKPRTNCETCLAVYNQRKELGIKETRKR